MSYRKEKKFKLTKSEINKVKKDLNRLGMRKLYLNRKINSIYFDNKNFDIFKDSEEGVLPRKKIRVRWYDQKAEFKKEIKISSSEGRFKINKKLNQIKNKRILLTEELHWVYFLLKREVETESQFLRKNIKMQFTEKR